MREIFKKNVDIFSCMIQIGGRERVALFTHFDSRGCIADKAIRQKQQRNNRQIDMM